MRHRSTATDGAFSCSDLEKSEISRRENELNSTG
jgi:hypothetical protein